MLSYCDALLMHYVGSFCTVLKEILLIRHDPSKINDFGQVFNIIVSWERYAPSGQEHSNEDIDYNF